MQSREQRPQHSAKSELAKLFGCDPAAAVVYSHLFNLGIPNNYFRMSGLEFGRGRASRTAEVD